MNHFQTTTTLKFCYSVFVLLLFLSFTPSVNADDTEAMTETSHLTVTESYILNKGESVTLQPFIDGIPIVTTDYIFKSTNRRIAKVSNTGIVTAKRNGVARIIIRSKTNNFLVCKTKINVGKRITRIRLNYSKKDIELGNYFMLKTSIAPFKAAVKKLKYSTSDPNIAIVSSKGKVSAQGIGTATITVSTTDGSNLSKTCIVTVDDDEESTETTEQLRNTFPNPFFQNKRATQIFESTQTTNEK